MGYLLFLFIFLTWLNVRQLRKAFIYIARKDGYPKSLLVRILDIIADYQAERKAFKKSIKKESKKEGEADEHAN